MSSPLTSTTLAANRDCRRSAMKQTFFTVATLFVAIECVLGASLVAAEPRGDFKIFDGQPTRLYFTGNPHHPTPAETTSASCGLKRFSSTMAAMCRTGAKKK